MPEMSKATLCGHRVERVIFGFSVDDGPVVRGEKAAEMIVAPVETSRPTDADMLAVLKLALPYLEHEAVQALGFAVHPQVVANYIRDIINKTSGK